MEKTEYTHPLEQDKPKNRFASFTPFSWTPTVKRSNANINFITQAHDIAAGIETILQLIERSSLDRDHEDGVPVLNLAHEGALMRMAISCSSLLAERAMEILSEREDAARIETENN